MSSHLLTAAKRSAAAEILSKRGPRRASGVKWGRLAIAGLILSASLANAKQGGADSGVLDFYTKVGSFKIVSPSQKVKARGSINMSFNGTVLVVGLKGTITPSGGVTQEYKNDAQGRQVYHGVGSLKLSGEWRAIQFFGRDFKGHWEGMGIVRLYGEFDDKLETGTYVVKGFDPEAWGNGGRQVILPQQKAPGSGPKPKVEDVKKPG